MSDIAASYVGENPSRLPLDSTGERTDKILVRLLSSPNSIKQQKRQSSHASRLSADILSEQSRSAKMSSKALPMVPKRGGGDGDGS